MRIVFIGKQFMDEWKQESGCFTGSGLSGGDDIFISKNMRYYLFLNGSSFFVTCSIDGFHEPVIESKLSKIQRFNCLGEDNDIQHTDRIALAAILFAQ
jgi:hypothetical protein